MWRKLETNLFICGGKWSVVENGISFLEENGTAQYGKGGHNDEKCVFILLTVL